MPSQANFLEFKKADRPSFGMALICDIAGFSNFFNKPQIQYYITDYINTIISVVEINIWGGENFWISEDQKRKISTLKILPSMKKFLGDGMLYVWEDDAKQTLTINSFKIALINRLWNIQNNFKSINKVLHNKIPIADLPTNIKFGLSQGIVIRLIDQDGNYDYVGSCINLASRLVKYCPGINFIASARLNIESEKLEENRYFKIIAKALRSFENEIVFIDKNDYNKLNATDKARLFKEI